MLQVRGCAQPLSFDSAWCPSSLPYPGVDCDAEAIDDANDCAKLNHATNAEYHCADLSTLADIPPPLQPSADDVVLVDPPRAGLHPKFIAQLKAVRVPLCWCRSQLGSTAFLDEVDRGRDFVAA